MKLEIRFRHMDRSESLENVATEKIMQAVDGFLNRHDSHIQVWLVSDLNRSTRGNGSFTCEIDIRYPRKKQFFLQKTTDDMHVAIQEACDKLKDHLDNESKREIELRHQAPSASEVVAALPAEFAQDGFDEDLLLQASGDSRS